MQLTKVFFAFIFLLLFFSTEQYARTFEEGFESAFGIEKADNGYQASDFHIKDMNGKVYRLSDFRGKIVLINFWATWCPPCVREMPQFDILARKMAGKKFVFLAINVMDKPNKINDYLSDKNFFFPILMDQEGTVQTEYSVDGFPTSYIIDKKGFFLSRIVGARGWGSNESIDYFTKLSEK